MDCSDVGSRSAWATPRIEALQAGADAAVFVQIPAIEASKGEFAITNVTDILLGSVLRLSSPSQFNDPFELRAHFVMTATREQRLKRFEALVSTPVVNRSFMAG
jgi:hypothetical protein